METQKIYMLLNEQAARNVWQDALDTQHPLLKKYGYCSMNFLRHCYLMLCRIEGHIAYVDAIYHQLQDYENIFGNELDY